MICMSEKFVEPKSFRSNNLLRQKQIMTSKIFLWNIICIILQKRKIKKTNTVNMNNHGRPCAKETPVLLVINAIYHN